VVREPRDQRAAVPDLVVLLLDRERSSRLIRRAHVMRNETPARRTSG